MYEFSEAEGKYLARFRLSKIQNKLVRMCDSCWVLYEPLAKKFREIVENVCILHRPISLRNFDSSSVVIWFP